MGTQGIKTEHAGHKGSGRKSGFWGLRADAKYNSKHRRRTMDKLAVKENDMVAYTDDVAAKLIVDDIIDDLCDRRGLRQEWDETDEDIQKEIKDTWKNIILQHLKRRKL